MKRLLLILFGVLIALPIFARDFEYEYEGQILTYTVIDEEAKTVKTKEGKSYNSPGNKVSGNLIIPEITRDEGVEYTVISIGSAAFSQCWSLTSVTIPNSVTSIDACAFYNCNSLTSVIIPNSVTEIGMSAFSSCSSLTEVTIPNSVTTIGMAAFSECGSLTSVTIPSSVTTLGFYVFGNCSSMTEVKIPNSITSIPESTFEGCISLTSVTIPESVTSIGNNAFYNSSLKWVLLPESVTEVGRYAFGHNSDLFNNNLLYIIICNPDIVIHNPLINIYQQPYVTLCLPEGTDFDNTNSERIIYYNPMGEVSVLENGILLTNDGKTLTAIPNNVDNNCVIPEGVEIIGSDAFKYANNLESLTIPGSLKEIETNAFRNTRIEKVNFTDWPAWYANVKLGNFYSNPYWNGKPYVDGLAMTTPELTEGMTEIPDYKDYGLQFKNEVDLPTTIKRIGAYAFYNNKELYSVILPAGLEEIGESAFEDCALLENPVFPAGLKRIEDCAYKGCTKITEITLPAGLTYLGEMTPRDIVEEGLPDWRGSDSYRGGIFEGCTALEKAVLVSDIDYLDDKIFRDCAALQTVFLPLQLKNIGEYAFYNSGLDEITFPATLETIDEYAFSNSGWKRGLTTVVIPNNVTSLGRCAFENQSITSLTVGSGLKTIPAGAFHYNMIQTLSFSEGLEKIDSYAFAYNGGVIGTVNLPSTVTSIGEDAFLESWICEMNVPDMVISLPSGSCGVPSVLTIGTGVKEINADAFSFENLYTIRLKAHTPPTLSDAFPLTEKENDQLTLIVNKGRHDYYSTNARWKQIDNIIEEGQSEVEIYMTGNYSISTEIRLTSGLMPSSVTKMKVVGPLTPNDLIIIKENMPALTSLDMSEVNNVNAIPDNQFNGSLLTDIVLPANLERVGNYTFADCALLRITELPGSLKSIGTSAFSGSPRVNISMLPESLERIGDGAFSRTGLLSITANAALTEIGISAYSYCNLLETADFSASSLMFIPDSAFEGCSELDQIVLPAELESIGANAFNGTALRNIDFATAVTEIGYGAFANNRRLVAASLPETLETVSGNLFYNCPRLIAVSMPSTTTQIGTQVFVGDGKVANISCAALEAPTAVSGAFNGLRIRYVSLIVPTLSFQAYLDAPGWGSFQSIKNRIPVEMGAGITASAVSENEYQQMLEEDALEAAEDAAAKEDEEQQVSTAEVSVANLIAAPQKRAAARAKRRADERNTTPRYFASLFNGAQIQSDGQSGMRIFINPEEGVKVISIMFKGQEMLPMLEANNSILLPSMENGTLRILTDAEVIKPSIELNLTEAKINVDETVQLTATVVPANTTDKRVMWSSSDETVATVDNKGLVTGVKIGTATITAKTATDLTATCTITVEKISGIDEVDDGTQIRVIAHDGVISVEAPEGLEVEVYSITGQRVTQTHEYRIEDLGHGVYIVRVGGKTEKLVL